MRWLRSAKTWFKADRFFDLFFAFAHEHLPGFRRVLSEFAVFQKPRKPAKQRPYRPDVEALEIRVVPAAPVAVNDTVYVLHDRSIERNR
jgi:hypothetical protein